MAVAHVSPLSPAVCCGCDNAATTNLDWDGETAAGQPMCASCHAESARVTSSPAFIAMMARVASAPLSPAATAMLLRLSTLLEDCTARVTYGALAQQSGAAWEAALDELEDASLADAGEESSALTGAGWALVHALTPEVPLFCAACPICGGVTEEGPCSAACLDIALEEVEGERRGDAERESTYGVAS